MSQETKNEIEVNEVAGELYESYAKEVGGVAFNGDLLPTWAELSADPSKEKQANGWRAVARTAVNFSNNETYENEAPAAA